MYILFCINTLTYIVNSVLKLFTSLMLFRIFNFSCSMEGKQPSKGKHITNVKFICRSGKVLFKARVGVLYQI